MLINSDGVKGRCPVCGAPDCRCGGPTTVIPVDERTRKADVSGKLVDIPIGKGRAIRMYEEEAIRRGLLPGKKAEPAQNKKRTPAKTK